ncbi:hypothetical protein ACO1O0_007652 [Amphichorda felina]
MPPKLGQIVETILYTSDVPRLAEWYKDVTEDRAVPGGVIPKHGCPKGLGQHIAFACASHAEVLEWEEHFTAKGVPIVARMEWEKGGKSVYVHDWEGHVIEIMTRGVWEVY